MVHFDVNVVILLLKSHKLTVVTYVCHISCVAGKWLIGYKYGLSHWERKICKSIWERRAQKTLHNTGEKLRKPHTEVDGWEIKNVRHYRLSISLQYKPISVSSFKRCYAKYLVCSTQNRQYMLTEEEGSSFYWDAQSNCTIDTNRFEIKRSVRVKTTQSWTLFLNMKLNTFLSLVPMFKFIK